MTLEQALAEIETLRKENRELKAALDAALKRLEQLEREVARQAAPFAGGKRRR
jgi:hypothetical protein